ncbi:beta-ketoacyl-ACP synthase III [Brevibacillus sp. LEMMJ03]|uniref:3-oxoacyl-ACP synthase III family protein n=1 Tax=Brevibacillus sp. LEMMJ03 TaxID=2595056 RepID=UPI00117FFB62|nr:beta-ketoacyl-ACP synthase 3 [Brevibacillus sp. LEMMJ03]TRY27949.1 beta-ketoacyl-ACP synthase III [Brevibacillus sp. LEMMJ03]
MKTGTLTKPSTVNQSGLSTSFSIQGSGFYVPEDIVTNEMLTRTLDTTDEWIQEKTGIRERRYLQNDMTTSDMCVHASLDAICDAGIAMEDLDAIVLCTTTPDQQVPSTALIVKEKLGAKNAIPFDLTQAACAGGIYSILFASHLLQNQFINNVLVIGAEVLSRYIDPADRITKTFFGDAAGAILLQKTGEGSGLLAWDLDSSLNMAVTLHGGGTARMPEGADLFTSHFIRMNGREVWKTATRNLPISIQNAVQKAGLQVSDIDHFILHQANLNIIKKTMRALDVPMEKTTVTIQEYGNTGAASLFSALHKSLEEKAIKPGDYLVISAIGAGFLWGSLCVKYTKNQ